MSSIILSVSLSSWAIVFSFIRPLAGWFGGADIGAGLLIFFLPIATIPLALAGFFVGRKLNLVKSLWISVIAISIWITISFLYNYSILRQEKAFKKNSQLDCNVLPFHCAIRDRRYTELTNIRKTGAELEAKDGWGRTPLVFAISDFEAAKILLEIGANPNATNDGTTLLALALTEHIDPDFKIAQLLIQHGANVNEMSGYADYKKMPVLNSAISKKNVPVIQFLLKNGADPKIKDEFNLNGCERANIYKLWTETLREKCKQ